MGRLLRRFWQPVAVSENIPPGSAQPLTVLGEELTIFRSQAGIPFLVAGRCAHRCTALHTGWVEEDSIRCMYHGWRFRGSDGACVERPAERAEPATVSVDAYPLHEYGGLVFAYMGPAPAPPFDLPRKDPIERPGWRTAAREIVWDCNWFQQVENSLDAVHVSFVHVWGLQSRFGDEITTTIPELSYSETSAGILQVAKRSENNVRLSDWTFPNNNHVVEPGPNKGDPWMHVFVWAVPIDENRTRRMFISAFPADDGEYVERALADRADVYDPPENYEELFLQRRPPGTSSFNLIQSQDYVAIRGQGRVFDRGAEHLGASDAGIALLRRLFFREMRALDEGQPLKEWRRILDAADLPIQIPETAGGFSPEAIVSARS